jgi:hypothetical protein
MTRTTRLSQRKIKSTDPAYPSLKEQLDARNQGGTGSGYTMPAGGIPRTDMTDDVQASLARADIAYIIPPTGIPEAELEQAVRDSLGRANTAYQKPPGGIPISDLEPAAQQRLTDYTSFYVKPAPGIPRMDLDSAVQASLGLADSAYQKPVGGIPVADLSSEVQEALNKAGTAYQKPSGGIPLSDLAETVVRLSDLTPYNQHINDTSKHITDHTKLSNIGIYSHSEIDQQLDYHKRMIEQLNHEISDARDTFVSLGTRIDATIGKNTEYVVNDEFEWKKGTINGLIVNKEGNVTFSFIPEPILIDLYDVSQGDAFTAERRLGGIYFTQETHVNRGDLPWVDATNWYDYIGIRSMFYVYAPETGEYEFTFVFSGKVRMQVGGQLLFNDTSGYIFHNATARSGRVKLEGGRLYPVVIEGWYYTEGDRIISLYWKRPGFASSSTIPMEYLNHSGYATAVEGTYESEVIDLKDTAISVWYLTTEMVDYRQEDDVVAEVSTSDDGETFGPWVETPAVGEIAATPKRFLKIRFTVRKLFAQYTPMLKAYRIRYISSANNFYYKEIMEARDVYLSLKDRLDAIQEGVNQLADLQLQFNASNIHPEYFASVRLAAIELNLLNQYYNHLKAVADDYELLVDGVVDHLKTTNWIDIERSDAFTFVPGSIGQNQNTTIFEGTGAWNQFTLDRLDYDDNGFLRLAYVRGSGGMVNDILDNQYAWSQTSEAQIGRSYRKFLAQPFYPRPHTGAIKRIKVYRSSNANNTVWYRVMICPAKPDGTPDIYAPLWQSADLSGSGNYVHDFDEIYVTVTPEQKYFIVIQMVNYNNNNAYLYFWQSYNNSNASERLRSDNPENQPLLMMYTNNDAPSEASHWVTGQHFMWCYIEEHTQHEPEGYAEYIIDYGKPTRLINVDYDIDNPANGVVQIRYASSPDMGLWSLYSEDPKDVPPDRFIKVQIHMTAPSLGYLSPALKRISVGFAGVHGEIITKAFTLGRVPTHALLIVEQPENQHVRFFASRDDGHSWTEIQPSMMTPLTNCSPGTQMRLKIMYDGDYPLEVINGYALQGIYHRDITGQNITSLHEEYIAENGQTTFRLQNPYPMGNNALEVYVNGILQSVGRDYLEIDNYTVQFTEPLIGNDPTGEGADIVTFRVAVGAYDNHDMKLVRRIDVLEKVNNPKVKSHEVEYVYDENGRLVEEIYTGFGYHTVEYSYYPDGKKQMVITTTDTTITTEEFWYNDDGTIARRKVTVSEVAPS